MEVNVEEICELFEECCYNLRSAKQCLKQVNELKDLLKFFLDFIKSENYMRGNHKLGGDGMKHILANFQKVRKVSLLILETEDRYSRVRFKELVYKIKYLMEIVPLAYMTSEENLSSLDANYPRWQALRNITKTANLPSNIVKVQTEKFFALYNSGKVALFHNHYLQSIKISKPSNHLHLFI